MGPSNRSSLGVMGFERPAGCVGFLVWVERGCGVPYSLRFTDVFASIEPSNLRVSELRGVRGAVCTAARAVSDVGAAAFELVRVLAGVVRRIYSTLLRAGSMGPAKRRLSVGLTRWSVPTSPEVPYSERFTEEDSSFPSNRRLSAPFAGRTRSATGEVP